MKKNETIYLAVDLECGDLVTYQEFRHWADALLAAATNGQGEFKLDNDGYLAAYEGDKRIYSCGAFGNDDFAKNKVGEELAKELETARFSWVSIEVDSEDFMVCVGENEILDAATYGRQVGYDLRNADADIIGVEGDE